jgi:hypothetical protein
MLEKLNYFTTSHRQLQRSKRLDPGTIARSLRFLCSLAVLAFPFPQHLTTPELRKSDNVVVMHFILLAAMVMSVGFALSRL